MNPLVTVFTPSYNSPDLFAAIDSVLTQDYQNIQYIIVDDCSRDFSSEKVLNYINQNNKGNISDVVVIANAENKGTIKTSNIGLRHATGKYIVNLAGDDMFYDSQVVSDLVNEFERSNALIITGYRAVYDAEMKNFSKFLPLKGEVRLIKELSSKELFEEMAGRNLIFGCCTARSMECLKKYGLYDENYRILEDYTMNMKLLRSGVRFYFFDRVMVKYRSGGTSSATKINVAYEQEADSVFENEILPYSMYPEEAHRKYLDWKRETVINRKYAMAKQRCTNKITVFFVTCLHFLKHPVMLAKAIKKRI